MIHTQNFDHIKFTDFLKSHYHSFESHQKIQFFIKTRILDDVPRLMEAMIHTYCRAIGFEEYEIEFIKNERKVDIVYKNEKARE